MTRFMAPTAPVLFPGGAEAVLKNCQEYPLIDFKAVKESPPRYLLKFLIHPFKVLGKMPSTQNGTPH